MNRKEIKFEDNLVTDLSNNRWNGYIVNNVTEVINCLKENSFNVINNHNSKIEKIDGYLVIRRDKLGFEYVAPIFNSMYFSINPLYVGNDNLVHISTRSIGGVVTPFKYGNLDKAIKAYNEEHSPGSLSVECLEEEITEVVAAS